MSNKRTAKQAVSFTVEDLISEAKLPERAVSVCMRGDLAREHDALVAELEALSDDESLAGASEDAVALAEQIRVVEEEMAASERTIVVRAMGRRKFKELLDAHPAKDAQAGQFNPDTFPRELLAACAVEPRMTPTDADRLFDVLSTGQVEELFAAAWFVNQGATRVPFSKAASKVLGKTAPS